MSSTKRDLYADQKIDVDEVIKSNTNLVENCVAHHGRASRHGMRPNANRLCRTCQCSNVHSEEGATFILMRQ